MLVSIYVVTWFYAEEWKTHSVWSTNKLALQCRKRLRDQGFEAERELMYLDNPDDLPRD